MPTTRVAFAGLSPLSERIVREALSRSGRFQVVEPWTSLRALQLAGGGEDNAEILFIELADARLPAAVRAMQAAAVRLRIVALSVDATWARVFELREQQTVMTQYVADDLCAAIAGDGRAAARHPA
ncbi:MAG TPA: hypothetical protein VLS49_05875 [Usitatibacter sp.]|nr:hypothetical protein [Usitatibacter sp.]